MRSLAYWVRAARSISQTPSLAVSSMARKRRSLARSASSARSRLALSVTMSAETTTNVLNRLASLQPKDQTPNG